MPCNRIQQNSAAVVLAFLRYETEWYKNYGCFLFCCFGGQHFGMSAKSGTLASRMLFWYNDYKIPPKERSDHESNKPFALLPLRCAEAGLP